MKKVFILCTLCYYALLFGQVYEEILGNGYGLGMNFSKPIIEDIDNDGLLDLLIGHEDGRLNHFEQVEINSYNFELVSRKFNNIDISHESVPNLVDLDNDGLFDLIVTGIYASYYHYEQISNNSYEFANQGNINISASGTENAYCIYDIDSDGLYDLFVGNNTGTITHYEQSEDDFNTFILAEYYFSGINTFDMAFPSIYDINNDGLLELLIGVNQTGLYHYRQTSSNANQFELQNAMTVGVNDQNHRKNACFYDIDSDGLIDMLLGTQDGLLMHYEQTNCTQVSFNLINENFLNVLDIGWDSHPTCYDIDNDGLLDMLLGEILGQIYYFRQCEPETFQFEIITDSFCGIDVGYFSTPLIYDIHNDDILDLIIGEYNGHLDHYSQNNLNPLQFEFQSTNYGSISLDHNIVIAIADLNNDGLLDIIAGSLYGFLNHYKQVEVGSNDFVLQTENIINNNQDGYLSPVLTDLDGDGYFDLLVGLGRWDNCGTITHYEQSVSDPFQFELVTPYFCGIYVGDRARPAICDIDNDGREDLIIGNSEGGLHIFRRLDEVAVQDDQVIAKYNVDIINFPNPFNPSTTICFELDNNISEKLKLEIFNIKGQKVKDFQIEHPKNKKNDITWNGTDYKNQNVSSGVYYCILSQKSKILGSHKMILLK